MSTYWTLGRQRSCSGKGPESWLLLTSISWRRWRERRDWGREPEKRLELRWKTARSDRRPSSSGRVPARSPWLRSTPATVRWHESSGAGAQYTPKATYAFSSRELFVAAAGGEGGGMLAAGWAEHSSGQATARTKSTAAAIELIFDMAGPTRSRMQR
nr:unnamed protein product [Digitaria exilis]